MPIKFIESESSGYSARTIVNAQSDVTFAFAVNFQTQGEILTKNSVKRFKKKYIPISLLDLNASDDRCLRIAQKIGVGNFIINIAGNGIYSLPLDQSVYDKFVSETMEKIFYMSGCEFHTVVTGGQTGIDESGLKFGSKFGIDTICRFPKGWRMRSKEGKEIWSKDRFLERFPNDQLIIC